MCSFCPLAASNGQSPVYKHIWFITGPAGCGKSTVASHIASSLNFPYLEGDDYHSAENVEKMRTGSALTDSDRWDWLSTLRLAATDVLTDASGPSGVVVTCSALKRKYRDVMRVAPYTNASIRVHFVYLSATEEVLQQRVTGRKGHYMGADMVRSQFESLEVPGPDELDVLAVDVGAPKEEVERRALERVMSILDAEEGAVTKA